MSLRQDSVVFGAILKRKWRRAGAQDPLETGEDGWFVPTFPWESEITEEPVGSQLILLRFRAKLEIVQG